MKVLDALNLVFNKYLAFVVVLVGAFALFIPSSFTWAASYVTIFLQLVMFTMGLTMKPADFGEVFKRPWLIIWVFTLQYGWMPFAAYTIAKLFQLPPELALGLILVGSVPGGTASNVLTYLANGDVPLSVTATSVSTLLAPIFTPMMVMFYGGEYLEISFWGMFMSIVQIVLVPIVLGLVINHFFSKQVEKVGKALPTLSSLAVLLVVGGTVAINHESILQTGLLILLVVVIHNASGYIVGYLGGILFRAKIASRRTMAIEIGVQNAGLGASLALQHFTPGTAMVCATATITHTLIGAIYANLCQKLDQRRKKSVPATVQHKNVEMV